MKIVDLSRGEHSLSEVLDLARSEAVLIRSASGEAYFLEPADDIDLEVAEWGSSEKLSAFLQARSSETGDIPFSEIRKKRGL